LTVQEINKHESTQMAASGDSYVRLCGQSNLACLNGDYKQAMKLAKRAMKQDGQDPRAYYCAAEAARWSGDGMAAGQLYLESMRLSAPGTPVRDSEHRRRWAFSTVLAVDCLRSSRQIKDGLPEWMQDSEAFQAASAEMLVELPSHPLAWRMQSWAWMPEVKAGVAPLKKNVRNTILANRRLAELDFDPEKRRLSKLMADNLARMFPTCWDE